MSVMGSDKFVELAKSIANNFKTLYVLGSIGSPLYSTNKQRYINKNDYNRGRANKINAASSDTFGFDCVCLIKSMLWGWCGDVNRVYGGAIYATNGVPDVTADTMFYNYCYDKSNDFSNIVAGELVYMTGHIGIYVGDGLVVECTPIWRDGVQLTALGNIGSKPGYPTRTWTSHGKSNFIEYVKPEPTPTPTPTSKYYKVFGGNLRLRNDNKDIIGLYPNDTIVKYLGDGYDYIKNHFYKVQIVNDEKIGYMSSSYLTPTNTPEPTPSTDIKYKVINGNLLLLNDGYASIGCYPTGTIVKYLADAYTLRDGNNVYHYYKVQVETDGKVGYMAKEYLQRI